MKIRCVYLVIFCLLISTGNCFATPCGTVLNGPGEQISTVESIESTLKQLYNNGSLTISDLVAIHNGENPLANKRGVSDRIFSDVVDTILAQLKQKPEERAAVGALIQSIELKAGEQKDEAKSTKLIQVPMMMHDIPHGTFMMGGPPEEAGKKTDEHLHEVTISNDFRAANIAVTQWQWAMVMYNSDQPNPSQFKKGPEAETALIGGHKIFMKPNHPVERVSRRDLAEFLERINVWSQQDDPRIYELIPNHLRHARIRVLTEAEWEYIARNLGEWKGARPDGVTVDNISDYAWYWDNAHYTTHAVGELQPLIINGHAFYDLLGNVNEWVSDVYCEYSTCSVKDPTGGRVELNTRQLFVCRGAAWNDRVPELRPANRGFARAGDPDHYGNMGFRLAEDAP